MKTKQILTISCLFTLLLVVAPSHADTITATGAGDWYSTTPDAPWPGGIVPSATDDAIITGDVRPDTAAITIQNLTIVGSATFFNSKAVAVTGNLTVSGTAKVQQGATITIGGSLNIEAGAEYDPSCSDFSVSGNTTISGTLKDGCGGGGLGNALDNVTILSGGTWALSDVQQWSVAGNLSNEGTISGSSGRITFSGTGTISGSAFALPNLTVSGNYTIGTTVTVANNPVLNGTLNFDIGQSHQLVRASGVVTYGGALSIINTGSAPGDGSVYQLFSASSYNGLFTSINFPPLGGGLNWIDTLLTNGSITASSGSGGSGSPTLNLSVNGSDLTLSWDGGTFPGYSLQAQTNSAGISNNWDNVPGGEVNPFNTTVDPANPSVFYRLIHP